MTTNAAWPLRDTGVGAVAELTRTVEALSIVGD